MEIVIIGGDAAGMSAAVQIRRRQPDWRVTVLEKGSFTSYASCGIPYFLAGDVPTADDLVVVTPEEFRNKRGIDARTGWEATSIDPEGGTITAHTADGGEETLDYERLLIATGATPMVPRWEGIDLDGVVQVRGLPNATTIDRQIKDGARRVVVIGAGYIGLEMVEAFRRRGLEVSVVEQLPTVMGGIDPEISKLVEEEFASHGVELRLESRVTGLNGSDGRLTAVSTDDGEIEADLALVSLGIRPNVALAEAAGISLGESGAIAVDDHQRTGNDGIYAAGDCAEALHRVTGRPTHIPLALTANRQGRVAGANMAGGDESFPGIVGSAVTKVFDLAIARTGLTEAQAQAAGFQVETTTATAPSTAHYYPGHQPLLVKLVWERESGRLLGGQIAGRDPSCAKRCDILAVAVTNAMTVEAVAGLDLSYAPPFSPVWDPVLQAANRASLQRNK